MVVADVFVSTESQHGRRELMREAGLSVTSVIMVQSLSSVKIAPARADGPIHNQSQHIVFYVVVETVVASTCPRQPSLP
eukprot:8004522-Lingulodinium_polyedra.AAC.1